MVKAISRMQFIRGDFFGKDKPLRPPWALMENEFSSRCNLCGDCIEVCPTHIIKPGQGKFPVVDFSVGECLFCGDCVSVCKPQALLKAGHAAPWTLYAAIDTAKCLAYQNVECRSCYDPCEAHAINMTPRLGGVSIPLLNSTICTGCGACVGICPVQAVSIQPPSLEVSA